MKKVLQILKQGNEEWFINGWKRWADKLIILENESEYDPEITLITGAKFLDPLYQHVAKNHYPYIAINRPYLGSHKTKHRNQWRVSVNSFAPIKKNIMPHSRWEKIGLERYNWKINTINNVLIAPPNLGVPSFLGIETTAWAENISKNFPDSNIKIRYKNQQGKGKGGRYSTLWNDLDWADLVVSFSSAINVEAFWYGKKSVSLGACPTWICQGPTLDDWKDPREPTGREDWHEHIAWSQFSNDEWESGDAQEMTVFYQGWPPEVSHYSNFTM
jgi:hypothetical protein